MFSQSIVLGFPCSSEEKERKERKKKNKREARLKFQDIKVRKNPNSSRTCDFGWFKLRFEIGFKFVFVWSWTCLVKRAKM